MLKLSPALLIPTLICLFLLFSGWAAHRALTGVSDITDRDYYSQGLRYSTTLLEKKAASVLGWQLQARLSGNQLIHTLADGNGQPISGAKARIHLQWRHQPLVIPLTEVSPGTYSAPLPEFTGDQLIRSEFEREGARLSKRILLAI